METNTVSIDTLFKHQLESIKRFETIEQGLDLSDPGTGKTRVQIDLFAARRAAGGGCALVIAPKSLLESAWKEDIEKFAPHLKVSVARANNREEAFKQDVDLYLTNTDATRWLARQKPSFFTSFDTLIIDEASAFKHRTSARSASLRKIVKYFRYRYGLTGTPSTNTICDVWHQVLVIDNGLRLGTSFMSFRQAVATPIQVGREAQMVKWVDKPGAVNAVADLIADISVRYKLEECHDLPKNHVYSVNYVLPPRHRRAYDEMEKHAILELSKDEVISAVNAASLMTKLLQIASGSVYDESGTTIYIEDDRYQLILDLIAARRHSLVFFNWRHQANAIEALCQKKEISYCILDGRTNDKNKTDYVKKFQEGQYQVCLAHPQTAAHGLTLTKATTAIWASPTHNLEHFLQGNRRIYRAGQNEKTETILVTAKNTLEEKVYTRLQEKNAKQLGFLAMLKELSK